mmetsp:Transcript_107235/g.346318  ORF Transcript_107235/g.346318 Transcript_107235/m.346318 type:complete len:209 (+) Transcript_107235:62-688(+)
MQDVLEDLLRQPTVRWQLGSGRRDPLAVDPAALRFPGHGDKVAFVEAQGAAALRGPVHDDAAQADPLRHGLRHPTLGHRLARRAARLHGGCVDPAMCRPVRDVDERALADAQLSGLIRLPVVRRDVQQDLRLLTAGLATRSARRRLRDRQRHRHLRHAQLRRQAHARHRLAIWVDTIGLRLGLRVDLRLAWVGRRLAHLRLARHRKMP